MPAAALEGREQAVAPGSEPSSEDDKTFTLEQSSASDVSLGDGSGDGPITDVDDVNALNDEQTVAPTDPVPVETAAFAGGLGGFDGPPAGGGGGRGGHGDGDRRAMWLGAAVLATLVLLLGIAYFATRDDDASETAGPDVTASESPSESPSATETTAPAESPTPEVTPTPSPTSDAASTPTATTTTPPADPAPTRTRTRTPAPRPTTAPPQPTRAPAPKFVEPKKDAPLLRSCNYRKVQGAEEFDIVYTVRFTGGVYDVLAKTAYAPTAAEIRNGEPYTWRVAFTYSESDLNPDEQTFDASPPQPLRYSSPDSGVRDRSHQPRPVTIDKRQCAGYPGT